MAKDLGAATADAAASLVGAVPDHYGKIDILVNNNPLSKPTRKAMAFFAR